MAGIKAHTRYRLRNGDTVPSVTTVLDSQLGWSKRVLISWARREALAGRDPDKILRDTGDTGTCAHLLIQGFLECVGVDVDVADFSENQIKSGCRAFESFKSWYGTKELEIISTELEVVSEEYRYGGTLDILARGKQGSSEGTLLIDLKTSKAVYPEHIVQVAAYGRAYEEQENKHIDSCEILHLGKDGSGYSQHVISPGHIETAWEVFLHCRELYDLQKKLKGAIF